MNLDRPALDTLFSRASHWPAEGHWDTVAQAAAEHLIKHPKTGMLMVLVPAGKFLTDTGGTPFEVDLPAFYVAVHPVTNAQYARFVSEAGHRPPDNRFWQESGKMNHPVTDVSWDDATAFCQWAGLRLPTELEWEKAARGLDGRAYPWGKDWEPGRCRNSGNKGGETTANMWRYGQGGAPFGGFHLSGNVWEWCANWYDDNAFTRYRQGNLAAPSSGTYRVLRGGSWLNDGPFYFTASLRYQPRPGLRSGGLGFRCVVVLCASP